MNFIVNETSQKLRGGYYTPFPLARFISKWAITHKKSKILEPSCGDGVFIEAAASIDDKNTFLGIEFDKEEAKKSKQQLENTNLKGEILSTDFLSWYLDNPDKRNTFDSVVGNPPFIRYQYLPEKMQLLAEELFRRLDLKFTKHTNAWIPFVIACIELLKPGGRLGMIIPTEIFNVIYAQSLRTFLGKSCSSITIVDPEDIWFESTLQGAVILFAEKKIDTTKITDGLGVIRTKGLEFCEQDPALLIQKIERINGSTINSKWTTAFLSKKEYDLFRRLEKIDNIKRFSEIASVDVGIVTGANDFFLVNQETVDSFDLTDFAYPMFGRSDHCPGVIYNKKVHTHNVKQGIPSSFIWIKETDKLNARQKEYINIGIKQGLPTRYKCRIRKPWYTVPSVYTTNIGMLKRSHDLPRLIFNEFDAYTTDTAYRIKTTIDDPKRLVYSFINSLTALSAEIEGRSYGGGVLELVPSEINKLLIPMTNIPDYDLAHLDQLVRSKDPECYLPILDKIILGNIGISEADQTILFSAWKKLRNRRQRK
jgi:adenine-specific DNA methylase